MRGLRRGSLTETSSYYEQPFYGLSGQFNNSDISTQVQGWSNFAVEQIVVVGQMLLFYKCCCFSNVVVLQMLLFYK